MNTNRTMNIQMAHLRDLEARVKNLKINKEYYEDLFENIGICERTAQIEKEMKWARVRYDRAVNDLREYKVSLRELYNMDAFGYDSPCNMDDQYYEKKFRQDGYLNGIKF